MKKLMFLVFLVSNLLAFTEITPNRDNIDRIFSIEEILNSDTRDVSKNFYGLEFTSSKISKEVIYNKKLGYSGNVRSFEDLGGEYKESVEVINNPFKMLIHNVAVYLAKPLYYVGELNFIGNMHKYLIQEAGLLHFLNEYKGVVSQGLIQFVIMGFCIYIVFVMLNLYINTVRRDLR